MTVSLEVEMKILAVILLLMFGVVAVAFFSSRKTSAGSNADCRSPAEAESVGDTAAEGTTAG
jgi:hypothetical protein